MTVWLLGDQLRADTAALEGTDRVLLIEARGFAARKRYHPQKLTLLFSAMRHVRDELRERGYAVDYRVADSFGAGLDAHFEAHPGDELRLPRPASHGAAGRLRELVTDRGGSLELLANPGFLTTPTEFDDWARGRERYRQEAWYRHVRRETGYLMDGDEPVGGEWNYDSENRETPPPGWEPPPVPDFPVDDTTREVARTVRERYGDHWGRPPDPDADRFRWPVTRRQARRALAQFVEHRLPEFGPYQDAMLTGEPALAHSLLSASLNLGLLGPREVVEAAVDAYRAGDAPLNSVEGFVRQVIGWREFVRHVYRRSMPGMATANQLDADRELPPLYWDGDTDMRCLAESVGGVRERGYAHHIERLMVLSNFATLYGADPAALNEWFHLGFVDAYHWVTTPNVVGMGSFGTDALSSKPYVASANYVDRMSDHCGHCPYDPDAATGAGACPFNALYWDFLAEHEDRLRGTGRMGLVYSHLEDKRGEELDALRRRAGALRGRAREGEL